MTPEQNKAIVRQFHEAFSRGDLDACEALLSPDVVVYHPGTPWPQPLGLRQFRQLGEMFLRAFPDATNIIEGQVAEGDRVATRGVFAGTQRGEMQGLPPTGRKIKMNWISFDRLVDGKIVEHRAEQDSLGMLQQLGVIPTPEAASV